MDARSIDRLAAFGSIALLAALAIGTYYLADMANRSMRPVVKAPSNEPDFYVTGFTLVKLNQKGEPAFRISAKKMTHYPERDTSEFEEPVTVSLRADKPTIIVTARKAVSRDISTELPSTLTLSEGVRLERKAGQGYNALLVETELMTINPDDETASNEVPVKITSGPSNMTATGFLFDNPGQKLTLKSQVRGVWNTPQQ
jgi:lipopolysaccharide export system protein LptC